MNQNKLAHKRYAAQKPDLIATKTNAASMAIFTTNVASATF